MVKFKHLDELGIPIDHYFTNFTPIGDSRNEQWTKEREEYGFDSRETWNLDKIMVEWIYTRFRMYVEVSERIIDLDYVDAERPFAYYRGGEVSTQREAINIILDEAKKALLKDDTDLFYTKDNMLLLGDLMPAMWW